MSTCQRVIESQREILCYEICISNLRQVCGKFAPVHVNTDFIENTVEASVEPHSEPQKLTLILITLTLTLNAHPCYRKSVVLS